MKFSKLSNTGNWVIFQSEKLIHNDEEYFYNIKTLGPDEENKWEIEKIKTKNNQCFYYIETFDTFDLSQEYVEILEKIQRAF